MALPSPLLPSACHHSLVVEDPHPFFGGLFSSPKKIIFVVVAATDLFVIVAVFISVSPWLGNLLGIPWNSTII
jgi:hypothetical protein